MTTKVMIVALALCGAALCGATPAMAQLPAESDALLHRVFASPDFAVKYPGAASWMDEGAAFTTVEPSATTSGAADIVKYDAATGKRELLVTAAQLTPPSAKAPLDIQDYKTSDDKTKLLIFTNTKQVWRQNTRGDYWVLDVASGKLQKLGGDAPESTLMFAKFSPDGTRVAYVRENNIYVEDIASAKITPLTTDGSQTIVNGTSDWVYEEELDVRDGFRWSPDGKRIAYWQFDTSNVGIFKLIYNLGKPREIVTGFPYPGLGVYPTVLNIPIPIPGSRNSAVRVGVVNASGGDTVWLKVPGNPRENYIARMDWTKDPNEIALEHLNRKQNENDVLIANATDGSVKQIFKDTDQAWVDVNDEIHWVYKGAAFLWLSERDGWRHAYTVSRDGASVKLLTPGAYDVIGIAGVDEKNGYLLFDASPENATQRYLYRVKLDGTGKAERVSPADAPGTHEYRISPNGQWAFHFYSRADVTPVFDFVDLVNKKSVRPMEDNAALKAAAAPLVASSPTEFFKVNLEGGTTLDAEMIKPPNFDPAKKYPVLVYVYGEPAAQTVLDTWSPWNGDFNRVVAQAGYLVVSFDNRGTPAPKGRAWRKQVYGAIQPVIVKDQTEALQAFLKSHPYADAGRVAVWGWSGGGSSTLHLMFKASQLYQTGMSVAPVADLRLYDSIYQERYMGLPLENVDGYKECSAVNYAEGLKGHLLIVHGSGDDNVHYGATELLLNRLIELDKQVDFMEYPNRTHAIDEGAGTTLHLYSTLLRYLVEHNPPNGAAASASAGSAK